MRKTTKERPVNRRPLVPFLEASLEEPRDEGEIGA
jgi:hypothetical protein